MGKYSLYALYVLILIVVTWVYSHFNNYQKMKIKLDKIENNSKVVVDKVDITNKKLRESAYRYKKEIKDVKYKEVNTSFGKHSIIFN